mgnify:CR=1 FL=1
MRPELINASVLAYLGDSIFEVLVRDYLVKESGFVKPNDLQREAVKYVSASSHAAFMHDMLDEEFLVLMKLELINGDAIPKGVKMKVLIICIQQDLKQSLGLYT